MTEQDIVDALAREKVLAHFDALPDETKVGITDNYRDCPLVRYIKGLFPDHTGEIHVTESRVYVYDVNGDQILVAVAPEWVSGAVKRIDKWGHDHRDDLGLGWRSDQVAITAGDVKQLLREPAPISAE